MSYGINGLKVNLNLNMKDLASFISDIKFELSDLIEKEKVFLEK